MRALRLDGKKLCMKVYSDNPSLVSLPGQARPSPVQARRVELVNGLGVWFCTASWPSTCRVMLVPGQVMTRVVRELARDFGTMS